MRLYVILGTALLFAIAVAVAFYYRSEYLAANAVAEATKVQLANAVETNRLQQQTIDDLVEIKNKINEINANLGDQFRNIDRNINNQINELANLKESSPDAKTFLDTIVPDDIRRLQSNAASGH